MTEWHACIAKGGRSFFQAWAEKTLNRVDKVESAL
jgi:hypothetical protein